jgi:O-antigen/teichoic acid export membrane protein
MEQLGIYTAGYTISFYIADIIKQPLQLAVAPIYLRIYAEKGGAASLLFIEEVIGYVTLVIIPIFAGCAAIKGDLMVLLASSKYLEARDIIPWVLGSTLLFGCQSLLASSFSILKQTRRIALLSLCAAFINISFNLILLRSYGIIAAAWATAISYGFMILIMSILSYKTMPIKFPKIKILIQCLSATAMYATVTYISLPWLLVKVLTGMIIYCTLILLLDRKLFTELHSFAGTFRKVQGTA